MFLVFSRRRSAPCRYSRPQLQGCFCSEQLSRQSFAFAILVQRQCLGTPPSDAAARNIARRPGPWHSKFRPKHALSAQQQQRQQQRQCCRAAFFTIFSPPALWLARAFVAAGVAPPAAAADSVGRIGVAAVIQKPHAMWASVHNFFAAPHLLLPSPSARLACRGWGRPNASSCWCHPLPLLRMSGVAEVAPARLRHRIAPAILAAAAYIRNRAQVVTLGRHNITSRMVCVGTYILALARGFLTLPPGFMIL